jgi:hypothetical protein
MHFYVSKKFILVKSGCYKIVVVLPHQSNEDPSRGPIQESVKSIFTVFKGKSPKSTGGSLGGVGLGSAMTTDKEPSAAKNFSVKSTQCIKDATSAAISSPVAPAT